jgi:hypothetical protein
MFLTEEGESWLHILLRIHFGSNVGGKLVLGVVFKNETSTGSTEDRTHRECEIDMTFSVSY